MTAGPDNKTILHYVLPGYAGLGGPVRLLLDDAGIEYEYNHIEYNQFVTSVKAQWIESGIIFDLTPMLEYNGKRYSGSQPIMRAISKRMGKYLPADEDLEHFIDCTSDYAFEWNRRYHHDGVLRGAAGIEEYHKTHMNGFFSRFERIYGAHQGPFAAGQEITYVDFYVFYVIHHIHNKEFIKNYPHLARFAEAMTSRKALHAGIEDMKTDKFNV